MEIKAPKLLSIMIGNVSPSIHFASLCPGARPYPSTAQNFFTGGKNPTPLFVIKKRIHQNNGFDGINDSMVSILFFLSKNNLLFRLAVNLARGFNGSLISPPEAETDGGFEKPQIFEMVFSICFL